ncbi:hypothetical protein TrCOL_g6702 [Triparma columacea]|uniref:Uncharacterized protein n=1 Tax=Triparma columacea TaxID=722753 RepID=A0A9W7L0T6_9STRA|nr:hypothetical protein TrCOL_g6702 [Triparma columacea]
MYIAFGLLSSFYLYDLSKDAWQDGLKYTTTVTEISPMLAFKDLEDSQTISMVFGPTQVEEAKRLKGMHTTARSWGQATRNTYMVKCLVVGFVIHGSISFLISALVVPTIYLAEWKNDIVTMLVTGIVFPVIIFLVRKVYVSWLQKFIAGQEGWSDEKKIETLTTYFSGASLAILLTPSVLLYFNASVKYALFSALCQVFTEVGGKVWTAINNASYLQI